MAKNNSSSRKGCHPVYPAAGLLLALVAAGAHTAHAQEAAAAPAAAGSKRAVSIVPRVSVTETLTDNVRLSTNNPKSEQSTEISPGIRITSDGGRLKGYFDYALNGKVYAQNTAGASLQNALTAFGNFEAVDNWAFLDASANISQQTISALGPQSTSSATINANSTESTTLRLSPYLKGRLANFADYEARYSLTTNRSQSAQVSDVATREASLRLGGRGAGGRVGWSLQAGQQNVSYGTGRSTDSDSLTGTLTYAFNPQWNASVTGGQESNNFTSVGRQSSFTSGLGLNWVPSESTKFSASRQNRSFGESFSLSFDHRTAKTAWRFSDSRDVSTTPSQPGITNLGSVYDLYFAQFASVEPDPVRRAALVTSFLQANGISAGTPVLSSFLTSAVSVQRRQELLVSLLGVRDTLTFIASRSEGSRLDTISGVTDDLSNSSVVRQSGLSASLAHRLTPDTAVNVLLSTQQSSASQAVQDTSTKSINVSVSTKLGARSTASVSARRVVFESQTTPYTENAVTGTLNVQF